MKSASKTITVNGQEFQVFSDFIKRGTFAISLNGETKALSLGGYISAPATIKKAIKRVFFGLF
mgnify:CR=1 FL=1